MNEEQFIRELEAKGISLTSQQIKQFQLYFKTLIEWNQKINLTGLTDKEDVYLKHFFDSITPAFYYDFSSKVQICDVGAGAGFPSIPLKICFPQLKVTIVDSLKKRIGFLNELASILELKDVEFHHDRAEHFGKNKQIRESFDVVTARAVARMSVLSELCIPLVKTNGVFIAMKGSKAEEEISVSKKAIRLLGGEVKKVETFILPKEKSERSIIIIDKKQKTPKKYPRKAGTPAKSPIE